MANVTGRSGRPQPFRQRMTTGEGPTSRGGAVRVDIAALINQVANYLVGGLVPKARRVGVKRPKPAVLTGWSRSRHWHSRWAKPH